MTSTCYVPGFTVSSTAGGDPHERDNLQTSTLPRVPALFSDLHNADPAGHQLTLTVPLICITGDVLYGGRPEGDVSPLETQKNVLPFLSACAAIATTFMSLGNHEWMVDQEDLAAITATGVTVLDNEWKSITVDGKEVILAGLTSGYVTDYRAFRAGSGSSDRYPRQESISGIGGTVAASRHKPETAWLKEYSSASGYHILLSHHPEYLPLIPSSIELVLSGHAHGGQWRVFNTELDSRSRLVAEYTKGVWGRLLYAGLSNTTWVPSGTQLK